MSECHRLGHWLTAGQMKNLSHLHGSRLTVRDRQYASDFLCRMRGKQHRSLGGWTCDCSWTAFPACYVYNQTPEFIEKEACTVLYQVGLCVVFSVFQYTLALDCTTVKIRPICNSSLILKFPFTPRIYFTTQSDCEVSSKVTVGLY